MTAFSAFRTLQHKSREFTVREVMDSSGLLGVSGGVGGGGYEGESISKREILEGDLSGNYSYQANSSSAVAHAVPLSHDHMQTYSKSVARKYILQ